MNALEAAVLIAVLALPFHWLVQRELARLQDPRYLREHGVVIVSERALDHHSAPIGRYRGREIWGSVTFKGMLYRFDHVAQERERERISARELYLSPGLVYVTS
jgi:hypothetical protein